MTFVVINPQMSELAYGTHLFEGVYHSISLKVNIGGGHTLLVWLNGKEGGHCYVIENLNGRDVIS